MSTVWMGTRELSSAENHSKACSDHRERNKALYTCVYQEIRKVCGYCKSNYFTLYHTKEDGKEL